MAASSQVREKVLEEGAHPVGPVGRRFTLMGHHLAELLGEEDLGPGGNAGDTQATIQSWTVQLLPGKALKVAPPQEGPSGRGELLGHLGGHGQNLTQVTELGQSKGLQGISTKA